MSTESNFLRFWRALDKALAQRHRPPARADLAARLWVLRLTPTQSAFYLLRPE